MIRTAIVLLASAALAHGAARAPSAPPAPPAAVSTPQPCATDQHRAFDFWVGRWDVYPRGSDKLVAHSLIERLYGGCAIRENWMPLKGAGGGSLSAFVPEEQGWRQTWIDSSGARVEFKGAAGPGRIVLTGWWPGVLGPGKGAIVRMTYTKEEGGAVRQQGETSIDGGKSWQPSFDFLYRPAASTDAATAG
jgi:hypothetical protein